MVNLAKNERKLSDTLEGNNTKQKINRLFLFKVWKFFFFFFGGGGTQRKKILTIFSKRFFPSALLDH